MKEFILTLIIGCMILISLWAIKCYIERVNWKKRIYRGYRGVKCKYWHGEDTYIGTITGHSDEEIEITTMYHGTIKRNINDINPH